MPGLFVGQQVVGCHGSLVRERVGTGDREASLTPPGFGYTRMLAGYQAMQESMSMSGLVFS